MAITGDGDERKRMEAKCRSWVSFTWDVRLPISGNNENHT